MIRKLLTKRQVADILGIGVESLRKWRVAGEGPPYIVIGSIRKIYYDPEDLQNWIQERKKYPDVVRPGRYRRYLALKRAKQNVQMDNIWTGHTKPTRPLS